MPFFSVIVEDGQPEQAPCMREIDRAVLEAAIDDVAAVLRDRRADPGLDQLADLGDDLGVGGIVVDRRRVGATWMPAALPGANKGAALAKWSSSTSSTCGFSIAPVDRRARR